MPNPNASSTGLRALLTLLSAGKWVDLTPVVENGMPRWPSHPPVVIHPTITHEHDGYFNQTVFMSEHSGAHVDAPAHGHPGARTIETFSPDFFIGPAKVVHLEDRAWEPGDLATAADFAQWELATGCRIAAGDIVLVNYGWLERHWRSDGRWKWYAENMPGMSEDVAELMLDRGVRAIGTDTIACGSAVVDGRSIAAPPPQRCWLHSKLLRADVLLIECLANLDQLPDECLFAGLPLPISGGSGSPIRAVAFVPQSDLSTS